MPPAQLQRYVLGDLLGVGGMGSVYAAVHRDQRRVAVKMLHETLASDPAMVARFGDEARAAQRVAHRNVVRVVDHGVLANGAPFLVMDRVEGTPLAVLVHDHGPLPLSRIRTIAAQLLSGLAAIHRAGLVHGDMKSDNVLVDPRRGDHVTIIDFGLARPPGATPLADHERIVSGTPEYMAPELIRGEPITAAADLYAVGIILYEMLTGTTPFGGGTSTMVFERHLTDDVVPPSLRCQERTIPVPLEGLILRALAKDPEARHLNAELLATAIERAIVATRPEPVMSRSITSSTTAATRDCQGRAQRHLRLGFAEGTVSGDESMPIGSHRVELHQAIVSRDPDAIVVAYLGIAKQMIEERRLLPAARELEAAIDWLVKEGLAGDSLWRLLLTLAALYDGVDDTERSHRAAIEARDNAQRATSTTGVARADALLRRLGVCRPA